MDEAQLEPLADPPAPSADRPKPPAPIPAVAKPEQPVPETLRAWRHRPAVVIPADLLEAVRQGAHPGAIAKQLRARLGRTASEDTVRSHLRRLGIRCSPVARPHLTWTRAEEQRLEKFHQTRQAEVQALLRAAYAGDRDALITLHDRYRLRLPLIEARIMPALPWTIAN